MQFDGVLASETVRPSVGRSCRVRLLHMGIVRIAEMALQAIRVIRASEMVAPGRSDPRATHHVRTQQERPTMFAAPNEPAGASSASSSHDGNLVLQLNLLESNSPARIASERK